MNSLENNNVFSKIGIPPTLVWGYIGVLFFMTGDGIETGWISPFLVDNGFTVEQAAGLLTAYGITVAIASWASGVFVEMFGPKKTMTIGLIIYIFGSASFIFFGIGSMDMFVMYPTYMLRGLGYPLFAYSFLVWINYSSPTKMLGSAVGWFWFAHAGGLSVLGAFVSSWLIPLVGHTNTLWTSIVWSVLGAIFALIVNRDVKVNKKVAAPSNASTSKGSEFVKGLTILKKEPKVAIGGIVRLINSIAVFGFPVFLPMYMADHGYDITQWLQIWGTIFTANIAFNLVFGFIGDKFGWKNTVMWFGGVGTGLSVLALYYIPQVMPGNVIALYIVSMMFGAFLAGYVPLSALVPSLVKDDKGSALAILNLGAGLSRFIAPVIVGGLISFIGTGGIMWVTAIIYIVGAALTSLINIDRETIKYNNAEPVEELDTDNIETAKEN